MQNVKRHRFISLRETSGAPPATGGGKIILVTTLALGAVLLVSGCTWGKRKAAVDNVDLSTPPINQVFPSVTVDSQGGTGEVSLIKLTNLRELTVASDGMAAAGFDGSVTWSRDGQHIAIQMSNLTAASTQTQIVAADSGQRKAVVGGYNLHWDEANPEAIIFTQHQYYGEPDYGSHEVKLKVSQSDLFKTGVFNEATVPSEVIGDSAGQEEVYEKQPTGGGSITQSKTTPDGRFVFFTKEMTTAQPLYVLKMGEPESQAALLTSADATIGTFDLSADGRKIVYQQILGGRDEFGNWAVTGDQVKFYIADINY